VGHYDAHGQRGKEERLFEALYTEAGANCLAHYVKDVLDILAEDGSIDTKEAEGIRGVLQL
jgi:hypothetical protein